MPVKIGNLPAAVYLRLCLTLDSGGIRNWKDLACYAEYSALQLAHVAHVGQKGHTSHAEVVLCDLKALGKTADDLYRIFYEMRAFECMDIIAGQVSPQIIKEVKEDNEMLTSQQIMSQHNPTTLSVTTQPHCTIPTLEIHNLTYMKHGRDTVRVIKMATPHWEKLAYQLHLDDCTVCAIKQTSFIDLESACREMFLRWFRGEGRKPISWSTLVAALKEVELSNLAENIEMVVSL